MSIWLGGGKGSTIADDDERSELPGDILGEENPVMLVLFNSFSSMSYHKMIVKSISRFTMRNIHIRYDEFIWRLGSYLKT